MKIHGYNCILSWMIIVMRLNENWHTYNVCERDNECEWLSSLIIYSEF